MGSAWGLFTCNKLSGAQWGPAQLVPAVLPLSDAGRLLGYGCATAKVTAAGTAGVALPLAACPTTEPSTV